MCRGRGCFTELPVLQLGSSAKVAAAGLARTRLLSQQLLAEQQHQYPVTAEQFAANSGCLEEYPSPGHQQSGPFSNCPAGKLCCEQDLCNHIDSPAMKHRLNKTLQLLLGEQSAYLGSISSLSGGGVVTSGGPTNQQIQNSSSDGWFRTATIAVPICGFVVLLILASLAIRLLQPIPSPNDKLVGLRLPESASPPLLGHHHIHHHHHHHNKLPLV
ncbi:hypothetical protein QAD02_010680 [Eretmocerus hayati]|uniref:Uncharacterized protein n=1 Tax=Eretmocerus hayati TaxID=131215 RepID=A0ACC2NUX0_9HYME|nr:hypothetical protein QAD02_010680 [Eretmocerus hayati]